MVKALGTHAYLGGILIGAKAAGIDVVASRESWKPALKAAPIMGNYPVLPFDGKVPMVKLVIGNPPCTRFSSMLQGRQSVQEMVKDDVAGFDELNDILDSARQSGAKAMWWETGPLLWTKGQGMVTSLHDHLLTEWGSSTRTYVVRVDPRSVGVPQRRPRCHVISVARPVRRAWPISAGTYDYPTIGEYLEERLDVDRLSYPCAYGHQHPEMTPVEWAEHIRTHSTFASTMPVLTTRRDAYIQAVVSGRAFVWEDDGRWWDLEEYAAFMGIYGEGIRKVGDAFKFNEAQQLLSKGVCSHVAEFVARQVVLPAVQPGDHFVDGPVVSPVRQPWVGDRDIVTYDLKPKNVKRQGWRNE